MQHKCRVTVIDKKCYKDLQAKYLADPESGECPFYKIGDTFIFERYDDKTISGEKATALNVLRRGTA